MTREQAQLTLTQGVKVTHTRFLEGEYISTHPTSKLHYIDEDGNVINIKQFWRYRTDKTWANNWTLYIK